MLELMTVRPSEKSLFQCLSTDEPANTVIVLLQLSTKPEFTQELKLNMSWAKRHAVRATVDGGMYSADV